MKITQETVRDIEELLETVEEFRPFVKAVVETVRSFGPELESLLCPMKDWLQKERIKAIKEYENAGFSREHAILLTIDSNIALEKMINNAVDKKTK